jgi:hypothetical protein
MNDDPSDLQKLIRLKRFEQPPEDFVDNFVAEFARRQRVAQMKPSWWTHVRESFSEFMASWSTPQWAMATAAAAIAVAAIVSQTKGDAQREPNANVLEVNRVDKWKVAPHIYLEGDTGRSRAEAEISPHLLGNHFSGGFRDDSSDLSPAQVANLNIKPAIEVEPVIKFND